MDKRRRRENHDNTRTSKTKKFTPKMQASLLLVFCVVIIALIAIIGRLILINSGDGDKYAKRVLAQQTYTSSEIPYKRGTIYDRQGTVLAFSDKAYNLILDVKFMRAGDEEEYVEPTLTALLECYDFLSEDELQNILQERSNDQYVILAKNLTYDEMIRFDEYIEKEKALNEGETPKIQGVWFEENFIRRYPNNTLASSIIGFTTNDGNGNWGLEQYFNETLSGTNGVSFGYMDNELNLKSQAQPPTNGSSLVSTINGNVQRTVQDHIIKFNEEYGSKNIGVLLMDPNNGEIIAMASNEEYDLNNPADLTAFLDEESINAMTEAERMDYLNSIWRNFTISDSFEPGSTFKPFTIAAALDEGLISENQTFVCDGGELVGGWYIGCHLRSGHGTLTLSEALEESCNDAMMQIVASLGRNTFYDYHTFFGFGDKTGIDIPGEAKGLILSEEQLNASELATSSFGQTFTTTMLQMTTGYASIINGGNYYRPHLVKQILNDDGDVINDIEAEILNKTTSKKTSDFLNDSLYQTVEQGLAGAAKVPGYKVAGKTGTAQKQPRSEQNYVISFIGHAPAHEPELLIYVVIDEAQNTSQTNTVLATNLASNILAEVLPLLEIYPTEEIIDEEGLEAGPEGLEADGETTTDDETNIDGEDATTGDETSTDDNADGETTTDENGETQDETPEEDEFNPDVIPEAPGAPVADETETEENSE